MLPRPVTEEPLPVMARFTDAPPGIVARESRWAVSPGGRGGSPEPVEGPPEHPAIGGLA